MKKILLFSLFINLFSLIHAETYSWENGGTILGSYGNLVDAENVGPTDGVEPFDGDYMLTVSESPIDGTPQAFIGWVTDIEDGDEITACFYGYDVTPGGAPSMRIWGSWTDNDDINAYGGTAGGNDYGGDDGNGYTAGTGWDEVCHTFSTDYIYNGEQTWDSGEALVIQARLYSSSSGPDPTIYFIDMLNVTANSTTATIHFPGPVDDLTADAGPDQTVEAGSTVTLDGSGSVNPNGEIVAWQWEQAAGIAVTLDDEEAMVTTFVAPEEGGDLSFDLTIFDSEGNESSDSVTIIVQALCGDGELFISEIQGQLDASPCIGQIVTTTGCVMGIAEFGFFIQDAPGAWNGIWVLDYGDAVVDVGEEVEVTGIVEEFYDLTEIDISSGGSYNVLSTGNSLYNSSTITQPEESYESVLVTVSGVCESLPDDYGEWLLSDVWIDDLMYAFTPILGQDYTITGCLNYSFGNYKVEPRGPSDVGSLSITEPPDNFAILHTYPNPFNPEISIEFSTALGGNVEISIFNMLGQQLEILYNDITVPGVVNYINWDASQYGSGNYLIQVNLNQEVSSHIVTLIK